MSIIKLKRSLNTSIPVSLANGEAAYTANGDVFYIGSNDAIVAIGGLRVPGVLTANQAIVANSTSMIDKIMLGNTTVNAVANSLAFTLANSTVTFSLNKPTAAQVSSGDYFPSSDSTWKQVSGGTTSPGTPNTSIQFNDSGSFAGDANLSWDKDAALLSTGNSTVNVQINSISIVVGSASVNTTAFKTGANVFTDTVKSFWGNSTVNATVNSVIHTVQNATGIANLTPTTLVIGSATVNSTAHISGANVFLDTVKASFGNSTVNATVNSIGMALNGTQVVVNNSVIKNGANVTIDTVKANFGNSTVNSLANSVQLTIQDAAALASLTSTTLTVGILGGTQINTAANLSFTGANVSMPNANLAVKDLNLSGNLVVSGTVTTVDATNLQVKDSMIKLADQNAGTSVDIGFYGLYNDGSNRYTGLAWDASAVQYSLFANTTAEPTTTIDTGGTGFVLAILNSYLKSGNLVSNSTGVAIGANSTYAVSFVANTLSLSTPLPGTSGGTGRATWTNQDLLVANSTNGITPLGVGADGDILQVSGTSVAFGSLDGGTF